MWDWLREDAGGPPTREKSFQKVLNCAWRERRTQPVPARGAIIAQKGVRNITSRTPLRFIVT
jgi:hypothetical protein